MALLGPNGAGKTTTIDMVLGLTRPDSGSVSLFGMSPSAAVAAGRVGGMLQTGALIEYLTVREVVTMVASVYPRPLAVDDVLRLTGAPHSPTSGRTTYPAARRSASGSRSHWSPTRTCCCSTSRPRPSTSRAGASSGPPCGTVAAAGKTVIFATHYLEEADAYADRIVLLARGRIVADGPATEIKAKVSGRTIRATLPGADRAQLAALPGVTNADLRGDAVTLSCADSDAALRALLGQFPAVHDIEVLRAPGSKRRSSRSPGENSEPTTLTDIPEEVKRRLLPGLKAGVSTPRS